jgi:hypothetical protein
LRIKPVATNAVMAAMNGKAMIIEIIRVLDIMSKQSATSSNHDEAIAIPSGSNSAKRFPGSAGVPPAMSAIRREKAFR